MSENEDSRMVSDPKWPLSVRKTRLSIWILGCYFRQAHVKLLEAGNRKIRKTQDSSRLIILMIL